MPHIIVKIYKGRSGKLKSQLAAEITKTVVNVLGINESSVSVAIEDVEPSDWAENVFKKDILDNQEKIYKKPGYNPFE